MQDELDAFFNWCDEDSLDALIYLGGKKAGEFLQSCSDETLDLIVLFGEKVFAHSDAELMQKADEQTQRLMLANSRELAKWRNMCGNEEPKLLSDWLRSDDQEMKRLAQHLNQQLADFRVLKKAGLLSGERREP